MVFCVFAAFHFSHRPLSFSLSVVVVVVVGFVCTQSKAKQRENEDGRRDQG